MNIRVLREAGGIGDVIRILPALLGLREKHPHARIDVFVPDPYAWFVERSGLATEIIRTPATRRPRLARPDEKLYPYLATGRQYDLTVDLYCPGFRHEADNPGRVFNDRIELFCKAADVRPSSLTPQLFVTGEEKSAARADLLGRKIPEGRGWIAVQPFSTDAGRDYPADKWKEICSALVAKKYGVFVVDSQRGRVAGFPVPSVAGVPLPLLSAILSVCRLVIGPDSGLAHLAGAVGTSALGLTASQSGAVLYRHYPNHWYIQPPESAIPKGCAWPCYWARLPGCRGGELRTAGKSCAALAGIAVESVVSTAERMIRSPGDFEHSPDVEPIPAFDRALDSVYFRPDENRAALRGQLWEAFRVLKVGGVVAGWQSELGLSRMGFVQVNGAWRKADTWPHAPDSSAAVVPPAAAAPSQRPSFRIPHSALPTPPSPVPPPNQDEWEFAQLMRLVAERKPMTILEIGTKESGWIAGIADVCPKGARFIAVDVRDYCKPARAAVADKLRRAGQSYELLIADSTLPATVQRIRQMMPQVDLVHIDGLHTYEACRSDFENYSPLVRPGGLVVIHDVFHRQDVGVKKFWDELRTAQSAAGHARTWEWHTPRVDSMGIGVMEIGGRLMTA